MKPIVNEIEGTPLSERISQLNAEARELANASVEEWLLLLDQAARLADDIEKGGWVFKPGVREEARKLNGYLTGVSQRVKKLMKETPSN